MTRRTQWLVVVAVMFLGRVGQADSPELFFERDVRPILKANCFHCHGGEEKVEGKLDLRLATSLLAGGESGAAVVPSNPANSLLMQRIESGEMPPGKKKLTAREIKAIRQWIEHGAKSSRKAGDVAKAAEHDFTAEERAFWSFQPIRRSAIPPVRQSEQVSSPIDAFLLARLESDGLGFSEPADRHTLLRRLSFDLIGLPPTPEFVASFVADESPEAYSRLVDQLLALPQYGERWGRHWLDIAGYADSDGYSEQDLERKYAFKYRDYVLRAFNADRSWDEFLVEQLAGDELLQPPYANLSPEQADKLVATGFLRMGPDGTGAGGGDQNVARNEVMAETIKIVSTSLLGLSVGCAQCHNHRYDPIQQVDYYRFRALFEPAYDWKNWRAPGSRQVSLWTDTDRKRATEIDASMKTLATERQQTLDVIIKIVFDRELAKLPEEQRPGAQAARDTLPKNRTPEQAKLLKDHPSLNVNSGTVYLYERKRVDEHNKAFDARLNELKSQRPAEEFVACLTEVPGKTPITNVFFRGDINSPRQAVNPGELAVLGAPDSLIPVDDPAIPTSGRRLAYARHLVNGQHPLTARVLVNRFWLHHFGRGLVATPADFGVLGARPSHPELLDWLASEFMASGWSLKHLHRLVLTSTAYQQSSRRRPEVDAIDPENQLLARMSVRRLEAEVVRDSMLAVSGRLYDRMFGKPVPITPDEVGQIIVGVDTRDTAGRPTGKFVSLGPDEFRRSLYVQVRRTSPLSMLETFDAPDMKPNCELRNHSTVSPQSLLLMNNEFAIEETQQFATRLLATAGPDAADQIRLAWQIAFTREPSATQVQAGAEYLQAQSSEFAQLKLPSKSNEPTLTAAHRALASYCQALLSSNRFLYVD